MDIEIDKSKKHVDERGFLLDFLKYEDVCEKDLGQIYYVTFNKKGIIRGEHHHKEKSEWFVVVKGRVKVSLKDLNNLEKKEFVFDGDLDLYERLRIGPNIWHKFECLSKDAAMINYANRPYHKEETDTWK